MQGDKRSDNKKGELLSYNTNRLKYSDYIWANGDCPKPLLRDKRYSTERGLADTPLRAFYIRFCALY